MTAPTCVSPGSASVAAPWHTPDAHAQHGEGLQLAVIYLPWANAIFKIQPLALNELLVYFALASMVFFAAETEKLLLRRGLLYAS